MANPTSMPQQIKQAETDIAVLQVRFTNLDEKMDDLKSNISELRSDIDDHADATTRLLKDFQVENVAAHNTMAGKIAALEKWKWMIMGAGVAIGALGSKPIGEIFTSLLKI